MKTYTVVAFVSQIFSVVEADECYYFRQRFFLSVISFTFGLCLFFEYY